MRRSWIFSFPSIPLFLRPHCTEMLPPPPLSLSPPPALLTQPPLCSSNPSKEVVLFFEVFLQPSHLSLLATKRLLQRCFLPSMIWSYWWGRTAHPWAPRLHTTQLVGAPLPSWSWTALIYAAHEMFMESSFIIWRTTSNTLVSYCLSEYFAASDRIEFYRSNGRNVLSFFRRFFCICWLGDAVVEAGVQDGIQALIYSCHRSWNCCGSPTAGVRLK